MKGFNQSILITLLLIAFFSPIQLQQQQNDWTPELVTLEFEEQKPITLSFAPTGLSEDMRIFWDDINANIPSGWVRDDDFALRYLQIKGDNFTGSSNGGSNAAHDHNLLDHPHYEGFHTHVFSSGTSDNELTDAEETSVRPTPADTVTINHSHPNASSADTNITFDINGGDIETSSTSIINSRPISRIVIVLKPISSGEDICNNCIALGDSAIIPTGFAIEDTLDENFLIGTAIGGNGGGAAIGSADHNHSDTDPHSHPLLEHTHDPINSGFASSTFGFAYITGPKPTTPIRPHHTIELTASVSGFQSDTNNGFTTAASNDPSFVKMLGLKNTSGSPTTSDNIIVAFVGSASNIPSGWEIVSSDFWDRQVKITSNTNEIGDFGGDDNHLHNFIHSHESAVEHNCEFCIQNHDTIEEDNSASLDRRSGLAFTLKNHIHDHNWSVGGAFTGDSSIETTVTTEVDNRGLFRNVILIKKTVSTCTSPEDGNTWVINCHDNCLINSDVDQKGGSIIFINSGFVDLNATLMRVGGIEWPSNPDICSLKIFVLESGGVEFE